MSDLHREDVAWLAGLLDGEGCFDSPRGNPRVRVKMADLDVIMRAADLMGTGVYTEVSHRTSWDGTPHSPMHVAQITGEKAATIMRAVMPWMGARRTFKITEILGAYTARKNGKIRLLRVAS